uniref:Uncharacterized protein n=1 Tax=Anguilla anguilla TaxID=7936 RepID=A0A0E9TFN2_ANGAN
MALNFGEKKYFRILIVCHNTTLCRTKTRCREKNFYFILTECPHVA